MASPTDETDSDRDEQRAVVTRLAGWSTGLFRAEAVDSYSSGQSEGQVLRASPVWLDRTYSALVAMVVLGLTYLCTGSIGEYARGPAVIVRADTTDVTTRTPGTVARVMVVPGQRVDEGQLLTTFHAEAEQAELARARREFELALARFLQEPADAGVRSALSSLRVQRELAEKRLAERSVRAPRAGVVGDVRIRPGQYLAPGESVVSLAGEHARFSVIAVLPGEYRPRLSPGMPLRLELRGFRFHYQNLIVDSIGEQTIGPNEIRRFMGPEIADTVHFDGAGVLATLALPDGQFQARGGKHPYHHGMQGTAELRVSSQRIIFLLFPALRAAFAHD
jgi:multidrug efflux pump subunit AcrA (membrane-fusion protein)